MPGYTIEKILGRGGMGAVYRGVQTNLDRPVAIKILPPGVEKEDPSFAERFKSEAKLMAKLNHPAVVAVYDFGTTSAGQLYFAMEYVDGSDVSQMIAAQGRLPPEHALAITAHVCDALAAAHELGIVHRDIKPANVLLNMKGQVKVADFGLAKVEEPGSHGLTKTGYAMGTPDFVAPEALTLGTGIDGRADLYAVGVMLYQMLTGNIPRGAFKPASVLVPGLDPRYDPIIQKAMQHDREERHQSAMELRRELDVILTVPLVQHDAPASAAIPVAQMAQAPGQRSAVAQKPVGKAPQPKSTTGTPARQDAAPAGKLRSPEGNAHGTSQTPKSKAPLFLGLGAAAAIGIGAFMMMGGKKPAPVKTTTPASKPASVASAAPKPAASTPPKAKPAPVAPTSPAPSISESPPLPVSASSNQKFPPGQWVKLFTKFEELPGELRDPKSKRQAKWNNGWIEPGRAGVQLNLAVPSTLNGNYALRARFRKGGDNLHGIFLRRQAGDDAGLYQLKLTDNTLACQRREGDRYHMVSSGQLASADEFTLEFAALGSRFYGRLDSRLLCTGTDATHPVGVAGFYVNDMAIRDIEVINLDGLSEAEALKILGVDEKGNDLRQPSAAAIASATAASVSSSPSLPVSKSSDTKFPPGQWVKIDGTADLGPVSVAPDGWIEPMNLFKELQFVSGKNQAIRMRSRVSTKTSGDAHILAVRSRKQPGQDITRYQIILSSGTGSVSVRRNGGTSANTPILKTLSQLALQPNIEIQLEFAVVGDRLFSRIDGRLEPIVADSTYADGYLAFRNVFPVRDIEVINLDGLPEAEALRILGVDEKGNDLRAAVVAQEKQAMEQAKVVDAASGIPELKALHEQFVKLQAERVTAPFEADVAKLNAGYIGGIDREIANEKKAGHLDGVIALEAEKKLIADKHPIPAEDDAKTTEALKKLRGIYRDAYAKLDAARAANLKALTDPLSVRLKQLVATLTQQDRVPDAKAVREYREAMEAGSAVTPDRNSTNGGGAATMNESDKLRSPEGNVRAPLKKFPPGDDRKAAEWALSVGGRVQIYTGGRVISVSDAGKLPRGKFSVLVVYLEFPDGAPKVPFTDMLPLAGLRELKQLQMLNAPVGDEAMEIIPSLPNLLSFRADTMNLTDAVFAHFALSKLTAFHLLKCMKVTGEKVAVLANGKSLEQLSLQSCRLSDAGVQEIGKLTSLTTLNLSGSGLNDDHLKALRGLKNLSSLLLKRNGLSAKALADMTTVWHDIQELEFDIRGGEVVSGSGVLARAFPKLETFGFSRPSATPYSAADFAGLKAFPKLKTIIIWNVDALAADAGEGVLALDKLERLRFEQCPAVSDSMMESLTNHKSLSSLRWAGLQITDISLTHIAKLRSLTKLEISDCPNLTDAAIAAFKKERLDVTVTK